MLLDLFCNLFYVWCMIYFEICLMLKSLYWIYCFFNSSVFLNKNRQKNIFKNRRASPLVRFQAGRVVSWAHPLKLARPAPPRFWRANSGLGLNGAGWPILPSLVIAYLLLKLDIKRQRVLIRVKKSDVLIKRD